MEAKQPEQQHGFRPPDRRLEEHLLTANLLLDKTAAAEIAVWIVRLDLSKAFDRTHWANIVGSSTRTRRARALTFVGQSTYFCCWCVHMVDNLAKSDRMGEEPEFFLNRWCATGLCFEPTTK